MTTSEAMSRNPTLLRATSAGLALTAALWAYFVWRAPIDAMQGPIQKILYVHVPCVVGAYLGFALTAGAGGLYLWPRDERYDRFAAGAPEVAGPES